MHVHILCKKKFIMWSVSSLLHTDLSCTPVRLNSCGTRGMHHTRKLVTSTRSVNHQPHVAHHMNISSSQVHVLPSNTCGTPDMHHTNKLVMSASFTIKYTWRTRHAPQEEARHERKQFVRKSSPDS